ncbi:putative oxidoreductase [Salmonella enterica subsp. diarizonae]|uniref:Putative oxidoreductase n=1 Tax=Salmonella diarizonae TaxID=59204 RepID=A0A379TYR9_SALDZ|nr:putative oxidoreductase [Salmonella enterica subsp. diarizonae]
MNDKIRVGLIGYGYASKTFHAPLIMGTPGLELAAVSSSDETKVKADWPAVSVVSEPRHLFSDPHIDLIVIPTPNDTHFPLAKAALEAGKHVVVDKPFTVTLSQARELDALARSTGRVLSVFHNRRWDSDFLTLKALLADGVLGEVSCLNPTLIVSVLRCATAGASKAGREVVSGTIWRRTCWIRPFNFLVCRSA